MAQVTLTIKLDLPALQKELQDAVTKIKSKLSEVGNVDVDFDLNDLQKDLDKVKSKFKETEESTKGVKGNLREAGLEMLKWIGIAQMVRGAFNFLIDSKNVARDAAEIQSKFDTVFSHLKTEANAWAENFAKSVGRAKSDVKSWMAELQDTFVPLGYTRTKAMELSESLVKLAVDVASFNNASDPDVIRDFTSALVGNHETVRKYGILITENSLKQEAENQGIKKKFDSLTELEKVQLRYNIILKSTTDAQGDAIRTADSLANQEKRQAAELKNMQEQLGNKVVPAFLLVTKATMGWITALNNLLGVTSSLIDRNTVMATQMEELDRVKKLAGKEFETYKKNLESELQLKVKDAEITLKQAQAEYGLYKIRQASMGGVNLENLKAWYNYFTGSVSDEEQKLKQAQISLETFSAQLKAIKEYGKTVVEDTGNTVTTVVSDTKKAVKEQTEDAYTYLMEMDRKANEMQMKINQQSLKYEEEVMKGLRLHNTERISLMETLQKSTRKYLEEDKREKQQHLRSLTSEYSQHFNFIINAAMTSTDRQHSFALQLKNYMIQMLKQYLVEFVSTKLAELTLHTTTEASKTAATETGVLARMALFVLEIGKSLAVAAASVVQAIASGIAYLFSTLGPFALPVIGAMTAATIGLFNGVKKALGFKSGGYTGPGDADEIAGPAHKGEYVYEKNLVDKEPGNYAMLHKLLRAGYSLGDIMLGIKKYTNPILEPTTFLAGVNLGSVTPTVSSGSGFGSKIESLLQSMDNRLRKIEEKEFELKGKVISEVKIKNKDIAVATKLGEKELNKGKANG